ncbi:TerB N-terminal domain-containing protein [Actinoplanes sp. ATCC 53533]|uniref:TerB N-terminal domain-containing protein n=1 Tax=Actinoplanes sp. ATCC 53533 TaxID=1288362 RepID=UPI000F78EB32|nr:TerB N-terminal domain-containing protein [Actinoplanes sp. ATCC 53533]
MLVDGYSRAVVQSSYPTSIEGRWVPHGQAVDVAGHAIPGGLIYVGGYLCGVTGRTEPALINPELPVASDRRVPAVDDLGPALAYDLLSPAARGAYLGWHAGGRRTEVPAGLVLLFCYGLERRVLHDPGWQPAVRDELPAIAAEVRRLGERYGRATPELSERLDRLLELVSVLAAPRHAPAAGPGPGLAASAPDDRIAPVALRVALARFAASATPVPAGWAGLWARHHPLLTPRGVRTLCPEEFDRLFTLRYHETFGSGLVAGDDAPGLRIRYEPANPELTTTLVCREDLADVLADGPSGRALGALVDGIASALDPYRRMVARFPQSRGSLAAARLLPVDLLDADRGRFGALRVWTEARFDGRPLAVVDGAEFAAFWSTASPGRMARDEAAAFIEVLALLGVGVEPDIRYGAPALGPGAVVLFRSGTPVWQRPARVGGVAEADRPAPGFIAAATIARCAAVVVATAGPVVPDSTGWVRALGAVADLAVACRIPAGQRTRLAARLGWLLATGVDVVRLPRQVTRLTTAEREIAGSWLVSVAAAVAPGFPPVTVAALSRVYRILGLEVTALYHRLHAFSVTGTADDADEPIVVRPADPDGDGFALPWSARDEMRLDQAVISRKIDESAAVATLLATIFETDDTDDTGDDADDAVPVVAVENADPVAGLDPAHSALLRAVAGQPSWTRDEFAALAGVHGVLPDGALDVLNEAAIDTVGGPLIADGVTLAVDDDVLRELLR